MDPDNVADETKATINSLFERIMTQIASLCAEKGLLLSAAGPLLTAVLVPVFMETEYELVGKLKIIEIITNHMDWIVRYKMECDPSFRRRFEFENVQSALPLISSGTSSVTMSEITHHLPMELPLTNRLALILQIERGLMSALSYLAVQIVNGPQPLTVTTSKSPAMASPQRLTVVDSAKLDHHSISEKLSARSLCESERVILCKLMDALYDRIGICCDVLSSRKRMRPSVSSLIEPRPILSISSRSGSSRKSRGKKSKNSKNQKKSKSQSLGHIPLNTAKSQSSLSSKYADLSVDDLVHEPIVMISDTVSLSENGPHRGFVDVTKQNLLLQGRYTAFCKGQCLEKNVRMTDAEDSKSNTKTTKKERRGSTSNKSAITLLTAFTAPSMGHIAYNFSVSFWCRLRESKMMKCSWSKQMIYRGTKGLMHPVILCAGSHPSIIVKFSIIPTAGTGSASGSDDKSGAQSADSKSDSKSNSQGDLVDICCPFPAATSRCFNRWFHVVVTLKDGLATLTLNGVHRREIAFDGAIAPPPTQFYNIGRLGDRRRAFNEKVQIEGDPKQHVVAPHVFDGDVRDLRHWFYPLDTAEIKALYDEGVVTENMALNTVHRFGFDAMKSVKYLMNHQNAMSMYFGSINGDDHSESVEEGVDEKEEKENKMDDVHDDGVDVETPETPMLVEHDDNVNVDAISSLKSTANWLSMIFKAFKFGGSKLRRLSLDLLSAMIDRESKLTLNVIASAVGHDSADGVLDEILDSVLGSVWDKSYCSEHMAVSDPSSISILQKMENEKDYRYELSTETMSAYRQYLRGGQGAHSVDSPESVLDADVEANISSAMGCELFHILWLRDENKPVMDHWICQHLKGRLDPEYNRRPKSAQAASSGLAKSYAQSLSSGNTKPSKRAMGRKSQIDSKNLERIKFIAILHVINGGIARSIPNGKALRIEGDGDGVYGFNPMTMTRKKGLILSVSMAQNTLRFVAEDGQEISSDIPMDSVVPIPFQMSLLSESSSECFNVVLKGITTAISKLFLRFAESGSITNRPQIVVEIGKKSNGGNKANDNDNGNGNGTGSGSKGTMTAVMNKVIVSRVTIMMLSALTRCLDPDHNAEAVCYRNWLRIAQSPHFNKLCDRILSLSKNVIPSTLRLNDIDILPGSVREDTPMLDVPFLEKMVQILQSYLWATSGSKSPAFFKGTSSRKLSRSKSKKMKLKRSQSKKETVKMYNWPSSSGPQQMTERDCVRYAFKALRGTMKEGQCPLCRQLAVGGSTKYSDLWRHFVIRHSDLLKKHIDLDAEFKKLMDALDGGDDVDDDAATDPRYKSLNQVSI